MTRKHRMAIWPMVALVTGCATAPGLARPPAVAPARPAPLVPAVAVAGTTTAPTPAPLATPACGDTLDIVTSFAAPAGATSIPTVASVNITAHVRQILGDPPGGTPFNATGDVLITDNNGATIHGRALHLGLTPVPNGRADMTADVTGVLDCGAFFELQATDAGSTNGVMPFGSHLNYVAFDGAVLIDAAPLLGLAPMIVPYSFVAVLPIFNDTVATRINRPCVSFLFGGFTHL